MSRILIIDGHPDPDRARFVHALADAYADGAALRHEVRRIDLAGLDIPLIRSQSEWMETAPPPARRMAFMSALDCTRGDVRRAEVKC